MKFYKDGIFYLEQDENKSRKEITDELWQILLLERSNGKEIKTDLDGNPKTVEAIKSENQILDELRILRQSECFQYINRGQFWLESLTEEQKLELKNWYISWLNVTKTKIIPNKPIWLS